MACVQIKAVGGGEGDENDEKKDDDEDGEGDDEEEEGNEDGDADGGRKGSGSKRKAAGRHSEKGGDPKPKRARQEANQSSVVAEDLANYYEGEILRLVSKTSHGGQEAYLVQWKDYQEYQDAYVSAEDDRITEELVEEYERGQEVWVQHGSYILRHHHRTSLTNGEWVPDEVIDAVQFILRQRYPAIGGLHPISLLVTGGFDELHVSHDADGGQIHHEGAAGEDHYTVSWTRESKINFIDSMCRDPSNTVIWQIHHLYAKKKDQPQLEAQMIRPVRQREQLCGYLAITYLLGALEGKSETEIANSAFREDSMGTWLCGALEDPAAELQWSKAPRATQPRRSTRGIITAVLFQYLFLA